MVVYDFQGYVIKSKAMSALLSLVPCALREASGHVVETLQQPHGESQVVRN